MDDTGLKAPGSVTEMLRRLDETSGAMPRRLKQCADFTRRHLPLIAVSTVSEMAEASDVAPSVYIRFCKALGFSGYSEMQGLFQTRFQDFRPDYNERLEELRSEGILGTGRLLADFTEAGHKSLMALENTVTREALDRIALRMAEARTVHLVGLRRAFAVVSNMAYLFEGFDLPANLHFSSGMLTAKGAILPGDVVFAVTFAPFSSETVDLAKGAKARGAIVIGLTDARHCPLGVFADDMLFAPEEEVGGFRGLNAALTLTTTLAVATKSARRSVDPGSQNP